jgi:hypothetical protein
MSDVRGMTEVNGVQVRYFAEGEFIRTDIR